jgi:hypothetical protein
MLKSPSKKSQSMKTCLGDRESTHCMGMYLRDYWCFKAIVNKKLGSLCIWINLISAIKSN